MGAGGSVLLHDIETDTDAVISKHRAIQKQKRNAAKNKEDVQTIIEDSTSTDDTSKQHPMVSVNEYNMEELESFIQQMKKLQFTSQTNSEITNEILQLLKQKIKLPPGCSDTVYTTVVKLEDKHIMSYLKYLLYQPTTTKVVKTSESVQANMVIAPNTAVVAADVEITEPSIEQDVESAAKVESEPHPQPAVETVPSTEITASPPVYGVSLQFLWYFIEKYNIPADMTTGEVVYKIIIPETKDSQLTYLESHLLGRFPTFYSDLRNGYRSEFTSMSENYRNVGLFYSFLSHPWKMPFVKLVEIAAIHAGRHWEKNIPYFIHTGGVQGLGLGNFASNHGDMGYFWVDVFCKNQHIPAPAMDEFRYALHTPGHATIAFWPSDQPISLQRIWCLYEIWTAMLLKLDISLAFGDGEFFRNVQKMVTEKHDPDFDPNKGFVAFDTVDSQLVGGCIKELFVYSVEMAESTVPEDYDMILGMIRESMGVEAMNEMILKFIVDNVTEQDKMDRLDTSIPCFDGEGNVRMMDGSLKQVKELQVGDLVYSRDCTDPKLSNNHRGAKVTLVTKDSITTPTISVCRVNGLLLTPEHPVYNDDTLVKLLSMQSRLSGAEVQKVEVGARLKSSLESQSWILPKDVVQQEKLSKEALPVVYNVELEAGCHSVEINGVTVLTLGHGLEVDKATDALYGWGWRTNPQRMQYVG